MKPTSSSSVPAVFCFCCFTIRYSRWCIITGQRSCTVTDLLRCRRLHNTVIVSVCCVKNESKHIVVHTIVEVIATFQKFQIFATFWKNKRQNDKNTCWTKHRNVHPWSGGGGGGDMNWVFSRADNHSYYNTGFQARSWAGRWSWAAKVGLLSLRVVPQHQWTDIVLVTAQHSSWSALVAAQWHHL